MKKTLCVSPHDTLHSVVRDAASSVRYPGEKQLILKLHNLHLINASTVFDEKALMLLYIQEIHAVSPFGA
jgi:hypothetical protein